MARYIQRGKLFLPDQIHLDPALCQFPLADVRNAINKADSFCGLVGLKAIGKTSTLELIAKEQPNVVYLKMKASGNVCHALYEPLKKSTYHLPWPLDLVRFDSSLILPKIAYSKICKEEVGHPGNRCNRRPARPPLNPKQSTVHPCTVYRPPMYSLHHLWRFIEILVL